MNTFQSLTLALRGHFDKPLVSLPPELLKRVEDDFFPWKWEGRAPRERCHRAKQWDYENDPALRERREGLEALTNPDSLAYSLEATQRLRGDFLQAKPIARKTVEMPPLEWDDTPPHPLPTNDDGVSSDAPTTGTRIASANLSAIPLTTSDIAHSFAGLRWPNANAWKKPLGDIPKWLRDCIAIPGSRGVSETHWNPVLIGAALVDKGYAKPNAVRAKFQTQPLLKPWSEVWKSCEADNFSDQ